MGASNRAMWRELGFASHRNSHTVCRIAHPCLEGKELFFTADAAHVLKNIRGQLLNSSVFTLSDATVCQHGLPSNEVRIDHVRAVVQYDSDKELKVAPKLSEAHVTAGHFTKMKVGVAVQFFREAPSAIRYLVRHQILSPEAETTAWFLELISKWYTIMSSRHPSTALSLQNMEKYHSAISTLMLALDTIQGMKAGNTPQWKPSQAGLMISTTVVLRLQDTLLKGEGYKFFFTSRILQDCLENLFSVVRLRKPVPNAYDMKCALKLVCVSQFLHTPTTTNYEIDDGQYLVDMLSKGLKEQAEAEVEGIDDAEIFFIEELQSADCAILFHIGGFLVKSIVKAFDSCEQCKTAVLGSNSSEHAYLTALKEYVSDGNNLHYPSGPVMSTLKSCEEHFRGITTWTDSALTIKSPVQAITAYLSKMLRFNLETCEQHKEAVQKMLVSSYARLRLRIHLRQIGARTINGNASKTCAGVTLP
uniref:Putative tick transposon n=1 Tax=Amblyomma aureolatum TaxID=187763 RepID=A0A1E1X3B8_9ACAR